MPYTEFDCRDITFKPRTVVKIASVDYSVTLDKIERRIKKLIAKPDPDIVRVYSWRVLSRDRRRYVYRYTMEKLVELTREEKLVIDNYYHDRKECIRSNKALTQFLTRAYNKKYQDLHDENVMKDKHGNYKLIDIEGFYQSWYVLT